jgi:hypothetical protein
MTAALCVRCGRPMPDTAYVCAHEAQALASALLDAAGHAEDAETSAAGQARYGGGGRSGSGDGITFDPTRSAKLDAVKLAVDGWTTDLLDGESFPAWRRTVGPTCETGVRCPHPSCAAIRVVIPPSTLAQEFWWLSGQMAALRRHPAADEAFRVLHDACEQLARLVDRPADKELVGMCDCGKVLYAPPGKRVVTCPVITCKLRWDVADSRETLRKALDGKLVTAAEAARLAQYLDSDRTQDNIRKLLAGWIKRVLIEAHGHVVEDDGVDEAGVPRTRTVPTYRFGDISERLARTPRRTPRTGVAA